MRSLNVLTICALALTGCATNPKPAAATAPATPQVAPPRDDCPPGYGLLTDKRGTACWKGGGHGPPWTLDEIPPPECKPYRCTTSGYMLWDCPEPEAIEPTTTPSPTSVQHWPNSRLVGCAPEHYLAVGVDGRQHCEKIVRGADGCPNGTMRTDSRGRKACLHGDVDLAKWPLEKAVPGPCPEDTRYECWYFMEEPPTSTSRPK